jgi:Uma2 family endonuclease
MGTLRVFFEDYLVCPLFSPKEYFAKGVRLVWVIAPEDRTVTIYRTADEGRVLHESALVTGEEVLPGFTCRVSDLLP